MVSLDLNKVVGLLNRILELELAGVIRYTHYSLLVFLGTIAFRSLTGCVTRQLSRWRTRRRPAR